VKKVVVSAQADSHFYIQAYKMHDIPEWEFIQQRSSFA